MLDIVYVLAALAGFVLLWWITKACERL